eukprot:4169093-Prymnesium_polylepis.1
MEDFYKIFSWWQGLQRLCPEFGQMIRMATLYKLAFELAKSDGRWVPRGKILAPSEVNVSLRFNSNKINAAGKHDIFIDVVCCGRSFNFLPAARPHSYVAMVTRGAQLQGGENPAAD